MDSFFQSSIPTLSLSEFAPYTNNTGNVLSSDGVCTSADDILFEGETAQPLKQIASRQNEIQDPVVDAENGGKGEENSNTNSNTSETAAIDNNGDSDDDTWNIRVEYKGKDHVYYMPLDAHKSYVFGYWKKEDSHEPEPKQTSNEFEVSSKERREDEDSEDWNTRRGFREKGFVYYMPSGIYRYVPGYWKRCNAADDRNNDSVNESSGRESDVGEIYEDLSESEETREPSSKISEVEMDYSWSETKSAKESTDDYSDLATPQHKANCPRIPTERVLRGKLFRVCRNFHNAKNTATKKRRTRLVKKLVSRRKKSHYSACARCGYAVERMSIFRRMF